MKKTIEIQEVKLQLASPISSSGKWVGQEEPWRQIQACWTLFNARDLPLSPRLVGAPGLGKTTLALAAAEAFERPVYLMQCTSDTRPEDLLVTPVLTEEQKLRYCASPLLSAVIEGGICILDEGNRMSEKSWASLAGLLDHRRTVESLLAGITVKAHPEFRCCVTMNQDASTFEIPEYILSRLQPTIEIPYPEAKEEMEILRYHLPESSEEILAMVLNFLQKAHGFSLPYSLRDGIHAVQYAERLLKLQGGDVKAVFRQALAQVAGEDALNLDALIERRRNILEQYHQGSLDDFLGDDEGFLEQ